MKQPNELLAEFREAQAAEARKNPSIQAAESVRLGKEPASEPETPPEATQEAAPVPRPPRILWAVLHCEHCNQKYVGEIADIPRPIPEKMFYTLVAGNLRIEDVSTVIDNFEIRLCEHTEKALRERFSGLILRIN